MNNSRDFKSNSAKETLDIISAKKYSKDNKTVDISKQIDYSIQNSLLYTENDFSKVLDEINQKLSNIHLESKIKVKNCSSMQAYSLFGEGKVGCLNFASAMNPGGGFINGSKAQEESLARASALYPTLLQYETDMYHYNRNRKTYLYSDRMIYSLQVPFFKDDNEQLLNSAYCMDIVTSPAVNVGAILNSKPSEIDNVERIMLERIDKILGLFLIHGCDNLILGAWGCGVFKNNPHDIARYFAHFLINNGKYVKAFKQIVFAVYDTSKTQNNIIVFEKEFLNKL